MKENFTFGNLKNGGWHLIILILGLRIEYIYLVIGIGEFKNK
jgi:hypothetical protein